MLDSHVAQHEVRGPRLAHGTQQVELLDLGGSALILYARCLKPLTMLGLQKHPESARRRRQCELFVWEKREWLQRLASIRPSINVRLVSR